MHLQLQVRGMEKAVNFLVRELKAASTEVRTDKDLSNVASVSAGGWGLGEYDDGVEDFRGAWVSESPWGWGWGVMARAASVKRVAPLVNPVQPPACAARNSHATLTLTHPAPLPLISYHTLASLNWHTFACAGNKPEIGKSHPCFLPHPHPVPTIASNCTPLARRQQPGDRQADC